jgi:exonuclease VII large subunit
MQKQYSSIDADECDTAAVLPTKIDVVTSNVRIAAIQDMGSLIKNDVTNLQQVVANNKIQADDNFQHLNNEVHRLKQ